MADTAEHGFTPAQLAWLEKRFNAIRPVADRGFDRATIMWMVGGLTALGVAASSILYTEIGSGRTPARDRLRPGRTRDRDQFPAHRDRLPSRPGPGKHRRACPHRGDPERTVAAGQETSGHSRGIPSVFVAASLVCQSSKSGSLKFMTQFRCPSVALAPPFGQRMPRSFSWCPIIRRPLSTTPRSFWMSCARISRVFASHPLFEAVSEERGTTASFQACLHLTLATGTDLEIPTITHGTATSGLQLSKRQFCSRFSSAWTRSEPARQKSRGCTDRPVQRGTRTAHVACDLIALRDGPGSDGPATSRDRSCIEEGQLCSPEAKFGQASGWRWSKAAQALKGCQPQFRGQATLSGVTPDRNIQRHVALRHE